MLSATTLSKAPRGTPWLNQRRLTVYPKLFLVGLLLAVGCCVAAGHLLVNWRAQLIGSDFINFYAASAQALAGHPSAVYEIAPHAKAERAVKKIVDFHLFDYPPTFLLLIWPFATAPYSWALLIWTIVTLAGYLAVIYDIAPFRQTIWLALAFPGTWTNGLSGQNAFLSGSLLGGGLLTLDRRPLIAGIILGFLTYKPHLALVVPVVLLASARWRALIGFGISSIGLAVLTLVLFGLESWRGFFYIASVAERLILHEAANPYRMQETFFAELRLAGAPVWVAYAIQWLVALIVISVLIRIWRGPISFRIKAAALVCCTLITTPYLGFYDLALLALPVAWLGCEAVEMGFGPFEKTALIAAWIAPLLYWWLLGPWLVALLFVVVAIRAQRSAAVWLEATGDQISRGRRGLERMWPTSETARL